MEKLVKMIIVVQPDTIDKLEELMEGEKFTLQQLKTRLEEKDSELILQVKLSCTGPNPNNNPNIKLIFL
jgi:DNA integrity scanning protein DisA with diadenylate cyclase activity